MMNPVHVDCDMMEVEPNNCKIIILGGGYIGQFDYYRYFLHS